jgi:hypothetical protein
MVFGYWHLISRYKLEIARKLIEGFNVNAALLAPFSEFNPKTLTVQTTFWRHRQATGKLQGRFRDRPRMEGRCRRE